MRINDVVMLWCGESIVSPGIVVGVHPIDGGEPELDILSARTVAGGETLPHVFTGIPYQVDTHPGGLYWHQYLPDDFPSGVAAEPNIESDGQPVPPVPADHFDPLTGGVVDGVQVSTDRNE